MSSTLISSTLISSPPISRNRRLLRRFFAFWILALFLTASACPILGTGDPVPDDPTPPVTDPADDDDAGGDDTGDDDDGDTADLEPLRDDAPDPNDAPDGWAGSTGSPANPGGRGAGTAYTYTVSTRDEFISALARGGSATSGLSKIIYVVGTIDLMQTGTDTLLDGDYFVSTTENLSQPYTDYADYMTRYALSARSGIEEAGLEADRELLYRAQRAWTVVAVGSNTSILGVGEDAGFTNGMLNVSNATNVVIRNLSIQDAYDYFPAWDGTDGSGLYNSEYDNVSVSGSTWIWIDHCLLGDGDRPDSSLPIVTNGDGNLRTWVTHDGLLDIVRGSNYVTVSWTVFGNHDKTMLIGNTDSPTYDVGKLKVTLHHNYFNGARQRLPRVRFGQVHVYNNFYRSASGYAVGVGDHARIVSEANYFLSVGSAFAKYDDDANPGYYIDSGSIRSSTDLGNGRIGTAAQVGWDPADVYAYTVQTASDARTAVEAGAGPGGF